MSRFTVPIADILGSAFYHYELTSSTYNPSIDTAFTITCKVTNVFGNNVSGKSITLYKDGTSVSSATTNSSGVATWTVTLSDWDNHHLNVANATLDLKADGWKTVVNETNYLCQVNGKNVFFYVRIGSSLSHPTTFTAFGGGAKVPSGYRPYGSVVVPCKSDYPLFVAVRTDGTVERRTFNSSQQTVGCYAFCEWTI